ncbi:hypothetical protein Pcinc_036818 [Petrolisthes cinctipes]|uniref:Uncharacterized protein n=1 Tax=Petrolisthes cinctipes TaxID=88211 RepID=A0AAE1BTT7_PETCI|nr:hypothetical protein Pcinc_036818 [Petrolisthes cinctipes]
MSLPVLKLWVDEEPPDLPRPRLNGDCLDHSSPARPNLPLPPSHLRQGAASRCLALPRAALFLARLTGVLLGAGRWADGEGRDAAERDAAEEGVVVVRVR